MIDIQQTNIYTDETQLGHEFEVVAHSLSYLDAISFDSTESEESVHDKKLITTAITTDGTIESESESESDSLYVRRLEHSHDSHGSTLNVDSEEGSLTTYADSHDANTTATVQESINDRVECRSYTSVVSEIPNPRTIAREGPFRFDRLHDYGKGQMKLRRELELIHKLELNKREIIFQLNLANKQMKLKEGYNLPPLQQRGRRIHDTYSQKKNEAGRKLRMEIESRRELRRIEKSLWN